VGYSNEEYHHEEHEGHKEEYDYYLAARKIEGRAAERAGPLASSEYALSAINPRYP
jgi:hypothetical protein